MTRDEMIDAIKVAMPFSPSFVNQDDTYVENIYYQVIGQMNAEVEHENTDITYEEVLTSLFGSVKGIEVQGVKVSRESLKALYEPLKLKKPVFKAVVRAHNSVLEHGLSTGNEKIIAIDANNGSQEASAEGVYNKVVWYTKVSFRGRLIAVHNHPQSTHFSPKDLYYFGLRSQTYCTTIQCHNGQIYSLSKQKNIRFDLTEQQLSEIFDNIMNHPKYASKTVTERGEIFSRLIANRFGWLYRKGDA